MRLVRSQDWAERPLRNMLLVIVLLAALLADSAPAAKAADAAKTPAEASGGNFNSDFNGSAAGWSAVNGTWMVSSVYYRSAGLVNKTTSTKHRGWYRNFTYTVTMKRTGTCTSCTNSILIRGNPLRLDPTKLWKPSYIFQYRNKGTYSVYYMNSAGIVRALRPETKSSAIAKNGWNTLKVVAKGTFLKYYINGKLVWSGSHPALSAGQVGIAYYRNSAPGVLLVDSASLVKPTP